MPKSLLYIIIAIETMVVIGLGILLLTRPTSATPASQLSEPEIGLSAREMTVYVKSAGTGEQTTDVVGKTYLQDDATRRTEFLFDLGAGCFPTWTVNPQNGYHLLVANDVDVDAESLDNLMRNGELRYEFTSHSDLQITKTLGIRSAILTYDDQQLRLNQQCS
jgi:hypothetical protein